LRPTTHLVAGDPKESGVRVDDGVIRRVWIGDYSIEAELTARASRVFDGCFLFGFELFLPLLVLPAREQEVGALLFHLLKFASDTCRIG